MGKKKNKGETEMKNKKYLTLKYKLKLAIATNRQLLRWMKGWKNDLRGVFSSNVGVAVGGFKSV